MISKAPFPELPDAVVLEDAGCPADNRLMAREVADKALGILLGLLRQSGRIMVWARLS